MSMRECSWGRVGIATETLPLESWLLAETIFRFHACLCVLFGIASRTGPGLRQGELGGALVDRPHW